MGALTFDSPGNLIPGLHCTWHEMVAAFGTTPHRLRLLDGLKRALDSLRVSDCRMAYVDGASSPRRKELKAEVTEYESLRSGKRRVFQVESFDQLPKALIQARIAAGLSQRELGQRMNLAEQQVQRYEATDYAAASLSRLWEVVQALHLRENQLTSIGFWARAFAGPQSPAFPSVWSMPEFVPWRSAATGPRFHARKFCNAVG